MEWSLIILHHKTLFVPESYVLDDGLFYGANPVVLATKFIAILESDNIYFNFFISSIQKR